MLLLSSLLLGTSRKLRVANAMDKYLQFSKLDGSQSLTKQNVSATQSQN